MTDSIKTRPASKNPQLVALVVVVVVAVAILGVLVALLVQSHLEAQRAQEARCNDTYGLGTVDYYMCLEQ